MKEDFMKKVEELFDKHKNHIYPTLAENQVPISGKIYDEEEILNLIDAAMECNWTEWKYVIQFQHKLSTLLGRKYAIAVNSGSSANLLAMSSLKSHLLPADKRMNQGDEVITVAAGFPTTVYPIIQSGYVPVFVDSDIPTYNANVSAVEKAVSKKTKAIFMAHTLGNPFNIKEIKRIADENNLWLIEDNCDALGSKYDGKYTGTFGHIATSSFFPAHHITTGEGGALYTDDDLLKKIITSMRDWGRDCWCMPWKDNTCGKRFEQKLGDLPYGYDHKYTYSHIGYNLKMTDLNAALGVAQIKKLDEFTRVRKENFDAIYLHLRQYENHLILPEATKNSEPSWFGFVITVKDTINPNDLILHLNKNGVATRQLFAGNILRQPAMINSNVPYRVEGELKNADRIMNRTFWVGTYPGITPKRREHMLNAFDSFFKSK